MSIYHIILSWNSDTQKVIVMEENINYTNRIQRDYSMRLKFKIVQEIEQGELSTQSVQRKYGIEGNATIILK